MRRVVHIVPYLPPQNSGVGDYATLVGRRMEEIGDVTCGYVAAGCVAVDQPADSERVRNVTGRCGPEALWHAVDELAEEFKHSRNPSLQGKGNVAVVLHYSGYGYDRNGAPVWLAKALRDRPFGREARVVTFFHELYANGWPWQRAFWYSARQRGVARDLARLSDLMFTNRELSARWLESQSGHDYGSVASMPIPSNVGEPEDVLVYESRPPRAVTFGGERGKRFALCEEAALVARVLKQLAIGELVDIGPSVPIDRRTFERAGIEVTQFGHLDAAKVSNHLRQCRVGLLDYPLSFVAKSSVFAAFGAHGVVPVLRDGNGLSADGVSIGNQSLTIRRFGTSKLKESDLARISVALRFWYKSHTALEHARAMLVPTSTPPRCNQSQAIRTGASTA